MRNRAIALLVLVGCGSPLAAQTPDTVRITQDVSQTQSAEPGVMREGQLRVVGKMKERMPVEMRTTARRAVFGRGGDRVDADPRRMATASITKRRRASIATAKAGPAAIRLQTAGAVESTFIVDPQTGTNYVFEQKVRDSHPGPGYGNGVESRRPSGHRPVQGQHGGLRRRRCPVRTEESSGSEG